MTREQADKLIKKLPKMNFAQLQTLWAQVFGTYCYTKRRDFIRKRLQWRINTLVSGGISERALKRAEEIADETLIRSKARQFTYVDEPVENTPDPKTGAGQEIIKRFFKGKLYEVYRQPDGTFIYKNKRYFTLSEVSTKIAGYYVSGTRFFGIKVRELS